MEVKHQSGSMHVLPTNCVKLLLVYFTVVTSLEHIFLYRQIRHIAAKPGCATSPKRGDLDLLQQWDYVFALFSLTIIFKASLSTWRQEKLKGFTKTLKPPLEAAVLSQWDGFCALVSLRAAVCRALSSRSKVGAKWQLYWGDLRGQAWKLAGTGNRCLVAEWPTWLNKGNYSVTSLLKRDI